MTIGELVSGETRPVFGGESSTVIVTGDFTGC